MAHFSNNATWTNSATTPINSTALENIEGASDRLAIGGFGGVGRTGPQIIEAYYAGTSGGISAASNTFISGNWQASKDTDSMYNNTGNIYMQAAVAGRFFTWGNIQWATSPPANATNGATAAFLTKNAATGGGATPPSPAVVWDARHQPYVGVASPNKWAEDIILAAGDKLYLCLWSNLANTVLGSGAPAFGGLYTHFGMRWIAPA